MTMTDVATRAGVSAQTVSRVLRQPELVGDEVSRRVREAILELQYVPNFAASQMASNRSGIVAAIIPTISASIFADTVQALSDVFVPEGYQLLLGNNEYDLEKEEELVRSFLGRGPDGLVLSSTHHTEATRALILGAKIPVVETWDWEETYLDLMVGHSNVKAARVVMDHFVSRGYRRIVFAGVTNAGDFRAKARLTGYRAAVKALELDRERVLTLTGKPLSMASGAETMNRVFAEFPDADAVFFSSDVFAAGALLHCVRLGVSVPGDIAIAGFGDFDFSAHLVPSLTTVSVHAGDIGRTAANLLLARMRGEAVASSRIDVGFELVPRESS
ncbi:LacI family DNA-binding transcriptional regulator [Arsenicitalea aurantiaca]|uniref:LacI family DNA-binding transcriptional regulator n=1 Tax=Arsenicitalea aurantiaca TaxID=1783274 RepID=A0A433XMB5_9HYPH|nr:LacI family DNA-binding transcriptional regulator [Arsenicitalea aurantiaca]